MFEPRTEEGGGSFLQLVGEQTDRQRVELHPLEQANELVRVGGSICGVGGSLLSAAYHSNASSGAWTLPRLPNWIRRCSVVPTTA